MKTELALTVDLAYARLLKFRVRKVLIGRYVKLKTKQIQKVGFNYGFKDTLNPKIFTKDNELKPEVVKKLRDNGIIERLAKVKKKEYDKKLSLGNEKLQEALDILEEIATGIAGMMGQQPNNLAGQENPYTKEGKLKNKSMDKRYKYKIRVNGSKKKEDRVQ